MVEKLYIYCEYEFLEELVAKSRTEYNEIYPRLIRILLIQSNNTINIVWNTNLRELKKRLQKLDANLFDSFKRVALNRSIFIDKNFVSQSITFSPNLLEKFPSRSIFLVMDDKLANKLNDFGLFSISFNNIVKFQNIFFGAIEIPIQSRQSMMWRELAECVPVISDTYVYIEQYDISVTNKNGVEFSTYNIFQLLKSFRKKIKHITFVASKDSRNYKSQEYIEKIKDNASKTFQSIEVLRDLSYDFCLCNGYYCQEHFHDRCLWSNILCISATAGFDNLDSSNRYHQTYNDQIITIKIPYFVYYSTQDKANEMFHMLKMVREAFKDKNNENCWHTGNKENINMCNFLFNTNMDMNKAVWVPKNFTGCISCDMVNEPFKQNEQKRIIPIFPNIDMPFSPIDYQNSNIRLLFLMKQSKLYQTSIDHGDFGGHNPMLEQLLNNDDDNNSETYKFIRKSSQDFFKNVFYVQDFADEEEMLKKHVSIINLNKYPMIVNDGILDDDSAQLFEQDKILREWVDNYPILEEIHKNHPDIIICCGTLKHFFTQSHEKYKQPEEIKNFVKNADVRDVSQYIMDSDKTCYCNIMGYKIKLIYDKENDVVTNAYHPCENDYTVFFDDKIIIIDAHSPFYLKDKGVWIKKVAEMITYALKKREDIQW